MAVLTLQACFNGKVEQDEAAGVFDFETLLVPSAIVDGVPQGFYTVRNLVTFKSITQTFRFLGLSASLAHTRTSTTVTDIGGSSYTFVPDPGVTDGSAGTRVMEVERVEVERPRISPHLWGMVVRRTGTRYYLNGTKINLSNEPAWLTAILG